MTNRTFVKDKFKLAQNFEKGAYPFVVSVWPNGAKIKIMNIKPKYIEGMQLPAGKYDLMVYKRGYTTKRIWVNHTDKIVHKIMLNRID